MCMFRSAPQPTRHPIAGTDNPEATRIADSELRRRRLMAGAAANVLTGPRGIPAPARRIATRMGEAA